MPALNFQKRFADLVESGQKCQTIRAYRKRPFKAGDRLYLYTGMRTKACRKLGEPVADLVSDIRIDLNCVAIDGQSLYRASIEKLALDDGFASQRDFFDFFAKHYGLPFRGQIIRWEAMKT